MNPRESERSGPAGGAGAVTMGSGMGVGVGADAPRRATEPPARTASRTIRRRTVPIQNKTGWASLPRTNHRSPARSVPAAKVALARPSGATSYRPTRRLDRRALDRILVAVDLETTGYEAESEEIIEIGAIRLTVSPEGAVTLGERFLTFANPGRPLTPPILRLTGIRDDELQHAPSSQEAAALFVAFAFRDGAPCFVGHNVGFDVSFLERAGMPIGAERLDTAELASILLPSAASYAPQRLAADAAIVPDAAHRALDDAITSALVLGHLARVARELPALVLAEIGALSELLGPSTAEFFRDAAGSATRDAWSDESEQRRSLLRSAPRGIAMDRRAGAARSEDPDAAHPSPISVEAVFAPGGPLELKLVGYEDRAEQRELAAAIERTFRDG